MSTPTITPPPGDSYLVAQLSTADDHIIADGPCYVARLLVGGGTLGTITIYDNPAAASGTVITAFVPPSAGSYEMGFRCKEGCTITTAAATRVTVIGARI